MQIVHVCSFGSLSNGAVSVVINLTKELLSLSENGDTITFVSTDEFSEKVLEQIPSCIKTFSFHDFRRILKKEKTQPEIVHFHGVFCYSHAQIAQVCVQQKIPYLISCHGNLMQEALRKSKLKKRIALKTVLRNYLRNANSIHALSDDERKSILSICPKAKIFVLPNGIKADVIRKRNFSRESKKRNGSIRLLFLGRIDVHHKGLDFLLESLNSIQFLLREKKVKLIIAGPYNSMKDEVWITDYISRNHLNDIVEIKGPLYGVDKEQVFETCDLFVHTSRYEGMPVAILEALSYGLPCLVTPGTNMGGYISQYNCGWTVALKIENISAVIKEIIESELLQNNDIRFQNCIALVQEEFCLDRIAKRMRDVYGELAR